ncbi:MAG: hypothetical protein ABIK83_02495 [Candidatus Zixiibacteriota bacterium]
MLDIRQYKRHLDEEAGIRHPILIAVLRGVFGMIVTILAIRIMGIMEWIPDTWLRIRVYAFTAMCVLIVMILFEYALRSHRRWKAACAMNLKQQDEIASLKLQLQPAPVADMPLWKFKGYYFAKFKDRVLSDLERELAEAVVNKRIEIWGMNRTVVARQPIPIVVFENHIPRLGGMALDAIIGQNLDASTGDVLGLMPDQVRRGGVIVHVSTLEIAYLDLYFSELQVKSVW